MATPLDSTPEPDPIHPDGVSRVAAAFDEIARAKLAPRKPKLERHRRATDSQPPPP